MQAVTKLAQTVGIWGYKRFIGARPPDSPVVTAFIWAYEHYKSALEAAGNGALRQYCGAPGVVVDVGANIGYFTIRFADWLGPTGSVIAIEPETRNLEILEARLARRDLASRVRVIKAGAAAAPGTASLRINTAHPGDHRIKAGEVPEPTPANEMMDIDLVSVDSLTGIGGAAPGRISLIKIDTQGHEMEVLLGSRETITRDQPALFIEVDPVALRTNGASVADLVRFLVDHGYAFWTIDRHERLERLPATSLEALEELKPGGYLDVLCLRENP